jgi:hypothetical protein
MPFVGGPLGGEMGAHGGVDGTFGSHGGGLSGVHGGDA